MKNELTAFLVNHIDEEALKPNPDQFEPIEAALEHPAVDDVVMADHPDSNSKPTEVADCDLKSELPTEVVDLTSENASSRNLPNSPESDKAEKDGWPSLNSPKAITTEKMLKEQPVNNWNVD